MRRDPFALPIRSRAMASTSGLGAVWPPMAPISALIRLTVIRMRGLVHDGRWVASDWFTFDCTAPPGALASGAAPAAGGRSDAARVGGRRWPYLVVGEAAGEE